MPLADHLDPRAVLLGPSPADKWELLRLLVGALGAAGKIAPERSAAALAAVEARERTVSTGLEQGVAVPHAAVEGLAELAAAVAVLPRGLDFHSLDGRPARIVVLLLVPRHDRQAHVRTLTEVARRLADPTFRERVLEARDPGAVVDLWR